MHHQFVSVAELLRHFYAILHRPTVASSSAASITLEEKKLKIAKLELKLKEKLDVLTRKRNELKDRKPDSGEF